MPQDAGLPEVQTLLRGNEEIDPDWREKFVAALKEHNPVLDSQRKTRGHPPETARPG